MLGEYDTDKDGFISLSEFIGDVRGDGKTIEISLKYRMISLLLVSSAVPNFQRPCSVVTLFCYQRIPLHSGRLKKQCGLKTSMIKIRMAS